MVECVAMSIAFKRSKILVTLGPATNSYDSVERLIRDGVNGFRLNFSHGSYEERDQQIEWIRQASLAVGKPVAVLQDLQGPKIRLGELTENVAVAAADELRLVFRGAHQGFTIPVQYDLSHKVQIGERLYIFDGKIRTEVVSVDPDTASVTVHVLNGGTLMSRKGINLPDTDFGGDILTSKDLKDIEYGATKDIDYVALSFVQSVDDITSLKKLLSDQGSTAKVVAKIETKAAIAPGKLEEIVKVSDAVMVARGDLAVEAGAENVPIVQRDIIGLCQQYGKISIVATQMMASMVDNPEPTRAEVSDIANAVITGSDCLMLSDETANGSYPHEAVITMKRVILRTQEHVPVRPIYFRAERTDFQDAISSAAVTLASQLQAGAIVAETRSGATSFSIASHRPSLPIISVTSSARVAQQLALLYANKSFCRPDGERAGLDLAKELRANNFFSDVTTVVLVSGRQPGVSGATDTIRVRTLD